MRKINLSILALLLVFSLVVSGYAADFPEKDLTLIVAYTAGGGSDITARIFTQFANKYIPKTMIVENYPGGGGAIGQARGANAKPDGYTLTLITTSLTIHPLLKDLPYSAESFIPVGQLIDVPDILMVKKDNEMINTPEKFISYAKENPEKIRVGTSGSGSTDHFTMLVLQEKGEMKLKLVPFGADAKVNLLGGHIDAAAGGPEDVLDMPDLKAIMVFADKRHGAIPDVPTAKELGIDWTSSVWRGIAVPKGTPPEAVDYLDSLIGKVTNDPDYIKAMENLGMAPVFLGADAFSEKIKQKTDDYKKLIEKNKD